MLDNLSQRLARVVKTLRGEARLTEANTQDMLREIRIALLEADVALPVVRDLIARIREKALGQEVLASLTPGQALVGVVHRELTELMGGASAELDLATTPPAIILMAGLQGAGKTTTVGKLARWLRETRRKKVLTVSCESIGRPPSSSCVWSPSRREPISSRPPPTRSRWTSRAPRFSGAAPITTTCCWSIPPGAWPSTSA